MLSLAALSLDSIMLDEAKAYLRLENDQDDASLGAIILAAIGHAEAFTGQTLIQREAKEILSATSRQRRLATVPVVSLDSVVGIPAEGAKFPLTNDTYHFEIAGGGDGFICVISPGAAGRIEITYQAGIAPSWGAMPEALRLGILRLIGHLYTHRDATDDPGPPTAVAALLRPYRRMVLS